MSATALLPICNTSSKPPKKEHISTWTSCPFRPSSKPSVGPEKWTPTNWPPLAEKITVCCLLLPEDNCTNSGRPIKKSLARTSIPSDTLPKQAACIGNRQENC